MRNRILVLPISALIITLLCLYAINRNKTQSPRRAVPRTYKQAVSSFILLDQNNKRVDLKAFLGRHSILLVFYNSESGPFKNKQFIYLLQKLDQIKKQNIIVLGISSALPQENRKYIEEMQNSDPNYKMPFHLLTDLPPEYQIHRRWGCFEETTEQARSGIFLIDRAGNVEWEGEFPKPISDIESIFKNY